MVRVDSEALVAPGCGSGEDGPTLDASATDAGSDAGASYVDRIAIGCTAVPGARGAASVLLLVLAAGGRRARRRRRS